MYQHNATVLKEKLCTYTSTHTHTQLVLNVKQPLLKVHNKVYFEMRLTEIWYIERRVKKVNIMNSRKHEEEMKRI